MARKTWIGIGAAIVMLGAVVTTWRAALAATTLEMEADALRAERATTETARRQWQAKLAAAEAQRRDVEVALASLRATAKKDAVASTPAARPNNMNLNEAIMRDPKLQLLQLASSRAQVRTIYGPLLQRLNLTDAQIAKLTEARVKRIEGDLDIQAAMTQQKLAANDPAIQKLRRQGMDELRSAQIEAIGDEGYQQLKEYERTIPVREMVNHLAGAAALNGAPLTADQAERMTTILTAAAPSGREGANPSRINWSAVDLQLQGVLSVAQLALFQQTEPMGGGMSRWSARLNQEMEKAQGTVGKPAGK